jgi:hypothetical protein
MGPRTRRLAVCAAAALAAAASLRGVTVLELENTASSETFRIALPPGETFSITSQHSMYDQPVTEEFVVDAEGRVVLTAVSSPSAAAREYLGITGAGERHAVARAMREVVFRVATGDPQRLRAGAAERSFLDFGAHGDRLVMRAARVPALARWVFAHLGGSPPGDHSP